MRFLIRASFPIIFLAGARIWHAVRTLRQRAQLLRDEFHEEALRHRDLAAR